MGPPEPWVEDRDLLDAHCKELWGLTAAAADSRRDWQMCPPELQPAVLQAFRHFGMLPPQP
jgi:hypothetical protein